MAQGSCDIRTGSLGEDVGHERTPKNVIRLPRTVESKGSITPIKRTRTPLAVIGDDTSLSEHCRSLRFLLNKRTSIAKDEVFKLEEIEEQMIYVTPEDVDQFLKMSDLNVSILEIFIKYVGTLCTELNENRFAFMLPSRLAILSKRDYERINEAADYLTTILTANKERHFILAPFVQDNHWMLLLFSLKETIIYVFDSLKQARDIRLRTPVQSVLNKKEGLGSRSYSKKEINEIRELWAKIFIRECL